MQDRVKNLAAIIAVVIFAASHSIFATALSDYHKRLDAARNDILTLHDLEGSQRGNTRLKNDSLDAIRTNIPPSEQVEWQGGDVAVDNQWLHDGLASYVNESDSQQRKAILWGIQERLSAISDKLDEIEKAAAAERSKDEDKQKLAEILRREEYQKPEANEESLFQKWWKALMKWLEDFFPQPSAPQQGFDLSSLQVVLQVLLYGAVAALIGFLLYRFLPLIGERLGYKTKTKKRDRVILGERIGEDESADDLFSEAESLALEGKLREAIRKGYIAVLCELNDRKLIGLARYKTNRDYLRDLRRRGSLFENMSGLTGTYERNWYGLRPSEQNDWEEFRESYKRTISSANT